MKSSKVWVLLGIYLRVCVGFTAVPLLLASHQLVRGLKSELGESSTLSYNASAVTNMLKKLVTECSSDIYLIVDQPGLKYDDLSDKRKDNWRFIYKYAALASTTLGLPWVDDTLDLHFLEEYIVATCQAEIMPVVTHDDGQVPTYYDTRKRVIKVDLPPLVNDDSRYLQMAQNDELLRKILRKLPSPHYTIILTSSTVSEFHPLPDFVIEDDPETFNIFSLITNDPTRLEEVERNARFHRPDPDWIENKHTNNRFLRNKKQDEIHLFDYELWSKYDKLVMTIFVIIFSFFIKKIYDGLNLIKSKIIQKKSKSGLIASDKKID